MKIQYYHRLVMAILLCKDFPFLLDLEMQLPGEDEVADATRLLQRMFLHYPRAFDVVIADGLYARASFFNTITARGKTGHCRTERRPQGFDAGCPRSFQPTTTRRFPP
jgi:hypothetical protein